MKRRIISMLCVLAASLAASTAVADDRPNVVIVLMDDMGFSDFASYGGEVETPVLDRLAENGLRFRQFYQGARCCPTRAQLLTGVYAHQAGVGRMADRRPEPEYQGFLRQDVPTIAERLKDAGYFTAHTGKWHVGARDGERPDQRGFDRVFGSPVGGIYYYAGAPIWEDGKIIYARGAKLPDGFLGTDAWADYGIKYAREALAADQPFFLYLANVAPHFPIQASDELIAKYAGRFDAGWDAMRAERLERQKEMGLFDSSVELTEWPRDVPKWETLSDQQRERLTHLMAVYAASIEAADTALGRIVQALDDEGELDNTLILVLSDNGGNAESGWQGNADPKMYEGGMNNPLVGRIGGPGIWPGSGWATLQNTPLRNYKHDTDEGGIRTPLIAHWPAGIPDDLKGQWTDAVGHLIDLAPTAVDLAGGDPTKGGTMEGISLVPALQGKSLERAEPIFWEHEGNAAVRDGKWKLVRLQGQGWRLYDIKADPTELRNLAFDEPDRVEAMAAEWQAWADRVGVIDFQEFWEAKSQKQP